MPTDLLAAMGDYIESSPRFATAQSVLVPRGEGLLYERYFRGYQTETINDLKRFPTAPL